MSTPRLITITFSHYCEKARWGLERRGIAFVEDGHLPIFHIVPRRRAGGGRTVPALVVDGRVLSESAEILRWADAQPAPGPRLYPEDDDSVAAAEVTAWEARCDRDLGPATRRWAYFFLLRRRDLVLELCRAGAPAWERRLLAFGFPAARALMRRTMRIDAAGAERSRAKIAAVFTAVAEALADGRRYLCGDRFTAADLTFAALAAPALALAGPTTPFPALEHLPPAMQAEIDAYRRTPAGIFATRLFAEEREPTAPGSQPG